MLTRKLLRWLVVFVLFLPLETVFAQEQTELSLRLSRDFGYSSGTGKIQGTFSMKVSGPENLSRVEFYLDAEKLGEVNQAPYNLRFSTDSYSQGFHTLYAVGFTSDGRVMRSNEIRVEFVSAEQGWQEALRIVGPIMGIALGIMVLSLLFPFVTFGRKPKTIPPGTPRNYGIAGGAICPRCGRPFPMHLFAPNLIVGKLEHCPYCGKWGVMRAKSLAELRQAEAAELQSAQEGSPLPALSEEEKLRKSLEDSRFQDM